MWRLLGVLYFGVLLVVRVKRNEVDVSKSFFEQLATAIATAEVTGM